MKRILMAMLAILFTACGPHVHFNTPKHGDPQCMTYVDNNNHQDLSGFYCRQAPDETTTTTTDASSERR